MYPFLGVAIRGLLASRQPGLKPEERQTSHYICKPWDLDHWGEMNHGRIMTLSDMALFPFAVRTGLFRILMKRGWALTMAGCTVRFRKRIRLFERLEFTATCLGHDERFFYLYVIASHKGVAKSAVLYRGAVRGKDGAIPFDEVLSAGGVENTLPPLPDWVKAWIAAEDQRPWPPAPGLSA